MNRPIRTISIFCMLLFLALIINATYLQYWQAGALDKDPARRTATAARTARKKAERLTAG